MTRFFLPVFLLLAAIPAGAQRHAATLASFPERRGFVIGGSYLYSRSFGSTQEREYADGRKSEARVHLGMMFTDHFGLFTGIGRETQTFSESLWYPFDSLYSARTEYLTVPVFMRLVTSKVGKVGFSLEVGLAGCLLQKYESQLYETTEENRLTYQAHVAPGLIVPILPGLECLIASEATVHEGGQLSGGGRLSIQYTLGNH